MTRAVLRWAVATVCLGLVLLVVVIFGAPGWAVSRWLTVQPVIAHAVAFPALVAAGVAVIAMVSVLVAVFRRGRQGAAARVVAATAASIAAVMATVVVWNPANTEPGTTESTASTETSANPAASDDDDRVRVLSWNTAGRVMATGMATVLSAEQPDIAVLPETAPSTVEQALTELGASEQQQSYQVFTSVSTSNIDPVTVAVAEQLGQYRQVPASQLPTQRLGVVVLEPEETGTGAGTVSLPRIVGVHPVPPVFGLLDRWRTELESVAQVTGCRDSGATIAAGDFNATLRHGPLATLDQCVDALAEGSPSGTWPVEMAVGWAAPIDHILVGRYWEPVGARVLDGGESDHRAVVTDVVSVGNLGN